MFAQLGCGSGSLVQAHQKPTSGTNPTNPPPATAPSANEFYVSQDGSDSNSGTSGSPWATLQHAAQMVSPGTVVHVAPGTYSGVTTTVSGGPSARIRFISDVKWGAKVRTTGLPQVWQNNASYIDIMGFDISGDGRLGILNEGSFVTMVGNLVHDIPAAGNAADGLGGAGIDNDNYSASDNDVIGNVVHDIGNPVSPSTEIQGIYHANLRGHIVNNIVYRAQAWGIHLWHAANRVIVANNLVFQNGEGGIIIGAGDAPGGITNDNTTVVNNMVIDHHSSWGAGLAIYEYGSTGTSNMYLNNLVWNNSQEIVLQHGLVSAGTINSDPLLVNYQPDGSGDYHLQPNSPAINAGTTTDCPDLDFDGAPRPFGAGPDIGVYEFGATAATWPWM